MSLLSRSSSTHPPQQQQQKPSPLHRRASHPSLSLSLSRRICEHGVLQPSLFVCSCLLCTSSVMANPPSSSQASPIFPAVETKTLPQDVLLEILLRLPVKSLVRFRAVHPSWQSLFQNPNFISAHFRRSNLLRPRKVLLGVEFPESEEQAAFFLSGETLDAVDTSEISNLVGKMYNLLGSCNGVFCVTGLGRNKFLLWNPATRETMVLPPPLFPSTKERHCDAVGFGLDPQGGDLKIVRLMVCEGDEPRYSGEVYSLKSRCWRKIQIDLEYISFYDGDDLYFMDHAYCNGSCHWMSSGHKMLSFDMKKEVFEWGKLPRDIPVWEICAGLSGGLLAMAPMDTSMEVWSMVGPNSWKPVKRFGPCFHVYEEFLMPVWRDNDEVVFNRQWRDLCFLNITQQEVTQVPVPEEHYYVTQLLPYAESLVSIRNSIL